MNHAGRKARGREKPLDCEAQPADHRPPNTKSNDMASSVSWDLHAHLPPAARTSVRRYRVQMMMTGPCAHRPPRKSVSESRNRLTVGLPWILRAPDTIFAQLPQFAPAHYLSCSGRIAAARTPDGVSPKRRRNMRLK